jgi:hypothetical protein
MARLNTQARIESRLGVGIGSVGVGMGVFCSDTAKVG